MFVFGIGVIGSILIHFFEKPAIIGSTSLAGAYFTMFGVDVFAKTGFATAFNAFLKNPQFVYEADGKVFWMIVGTVILAIVGVGVQFKLNIDRKYC